MESIVNSFLLVFVSEMGDKTQLLSLILTMRFKRPWVILFGVLIATLLNHALASWGGHLVAGLVPPETLKLILAVIFIIFSFWILIPDKEGEIKESGHFGVLLTTIISFFLAEMGDKTQFATIALGAKYPSVLAVTLGTTLGMLASNALAIFFGKALLDRIPMQWIRRFASLLFFVFGIVVYMSR